MVSKQLKETVPWKCVDAKVLSSLGLTSGVRKVMSYFNISKLLNLLFRNLVYTKEVILSDISGFIFLI